MLSLHIIFQLPGSPGLGGAGGGFRWVGDLRRGESVDPRYVHGAPLGGSPYARPYH